VTVPEPFRAFRVFEENGRVEGRVVPATLDELGAGGIVVRVSHSSVNDTDALAATGTGTIIRRFPLMAGIDAAGTVVSSGDPRFPSGTATATSIGLDDPPRAFSTLLSGQARGRVVVDW
jgi:acrylyl-CoA reductase (NADPH)